nr:BldC family transcriptional regulator [Allonocardiopsis opalescens]
MTAQEVARLFRVHPKTVTAWARQGVLPYIRTLGGHRRYAAESVRRLLDEQHVHDPREEHTPDTQKDGEP